MVVLSLGVSCPLGQDQLGWWLPPCPHLVSDLVLSFPHSTWQPSECVVISNDILLADQELHESWGEVDPLFTSALSPRPVLGTR